MSYQVVLPGVSLKYSYAKSKSLHTTTHLMDSCRGGAPPHSRRFRWPLSAGEVSVGIDPVPKPPQPLCNSVRGGDEVDQLLNTPAKGWLDICVRAHPPENLLPPFGDIGLGLGRETECSE